jgi:hypothetical protein
MTVALILTIVIPLISAVAARQLAARRGRNTAFWAAMGLFFGPFALPLLVLARKRDAT